MPKPQTLFDKLQRTFFEEDEKVLQKLTEQEKAIRTRYMGTFTVWLENPTYTDKQIVTFMMKEFGIEKAQAYRDISRIKVMLGNIRNAGKEWHRFVVVQMCQEAYNRAKQLDDPKAMAMAADKLGKYTRCDQLEADQLPFDQIVPPQLEATNDIEVLGFKRDPNIDKKRDKLRRKYGKGVEDAIMVEAMEDGT